MGDANSPAGSAFSKLHIVQSLGWIFAFLFGGGWLNNWLGEWDSLDKKANVIIEVLSEKDNVHPNSDDLDAWLAYRRVIKKAKFIRKTQLAIHPKEKQSLYGKRVDISFHDKNGWDSAIASFQSIEKKIHPVAFKKITAKASWSEISKHGLATKEIETIPENILAITEEYFDEDSYKKIKGFYTNEVPKIVGQETYPIVILNPAQLAKSISSKSSPGLSKKYFIPSFDEIPASYFEKDSFEKTYHPASIDVNSSEFKSSTTIKK